MKVRNILLYAGALVRACASLAIRSSPPSATVNPIYIFPNGTAAENLYVLSDNSVLLAMLTPNAALYYFPANDLSHPILLQNFTEDAAAYGITQYAPDLFAFYTGTFNRSGTDLYATGHVWTIDLTSFALSTDNEVTSPAEITLLTNLTNVGFLNGAATLDENTILCADSAKGVVYAIDTHTGDSTTVLEDDALAPNATGPVRLGVNGLAKIGDELYFTNTNHRSVGKVRLTDDGTAAGPYEDVAQYVLVDDLDVDPETGEVFIASLVGNAVTSVAPDGSSEIIAGNLNSTEVPGPTAIKFAKGGKGDEGCERRLFVSTSGGIEYPINGTYIQGGGLYELCISR